MATNQYFSQSVRSEQLLYEDIIIESLRLYGQDVYYLPRELVNEDRILGEDVPSRFNASYKVEMYIENIEGFDGEGDLFTKFGVEIRDQATFIISRRRWSQTVSKHNNEINGIRPREGDIIYLPMSKSLFQIMAVEHEQPFYQLKNLPTYKMRCELFEYSDEDLDTGIPEIDVIERKYAYEYQLELDAEYPFVVGTTITQTLGSGAIMSGEISEWFAPLKLLSVIHSGADDGEYHEWTTGLTITDGTNTATVTQVIENNQLHENEKNDDYDVTKPDLGFLDFSESNPFGDPQ